MRSAREIRFRLRQELANAFYAVFPPQTQAEVAVPFGALPEPVGVAERLRDSEFAREVVELAERVLAGNFPLLGLTFAGNGQSPWKRDFVHGHESGIRYFRRIPYLDFDAVGDHKIVWELNRHQHWVVLAQAHLFTGRAAFLDEIIRQWEEWVRENPFHRSINWTSALEVAFRALSWLWVLHLVGSHLKPELRRRFAAELYRHGCHLEYNLSHYFSPNTHVLGEAVALHALGVLIPRFDRSDRWRKTGADVVARELHRQVRADGAHFEQSTYYHVYALDFFLLHWILAGRPASYRQPLTLMAEYLHAVMGPARRIPLIGDDDGGRLFHPYGPHDQYGRATLSTCAIALGRSEWLGDPGDVHVQASWWLQEAPLTAPHRAATVGSGSRLFPDSGTAVMTAGDLWILADVGGFGPFRAGHSHSDSLSFVLRYGDRDALIDCGTFTYMGDPHWRNWFRGSAAHNTIRVDGQDQTNTLGPFAWTGKPRVDIKRWTSHERFDYLYASCRYDNGSGISHDRRFLFIKPNLLLVVDEIQGVGEHEIEQFWHPIDDSRVSLLFASDPQAAVRQERGWRSRAYGVTEPAPVSIVSKRAQLPALLGAALVVGKLPPAALLQIVRSGTGLRAVTNGLGPARIDFPADGDPLIGPEE